MMLSARLHAALPFILRRGEDVVSRGSITSTKETVHGLLRLDGDRLVVQWRVARETDLVGEEIRTDREVEAVREVSIPLQGVAGAALRRRWWGGPRLVLTAADLRAFEEITGEAGLRLTHPAELVLPLRRADAMAGEEFAAELSLAVAERLEGPAPRAALEGDRSRLTSSRERRDG